MRSDALTIEELSDIMADDLGPKVIGHHIWVENLKNGLIYAAIPDMDAEGIVAIWSVEGMFREIDYGKTWVAYTEMPEREGCS